MSSPKDHHFVPKVYLKEFSNSHKQLFQILKGYSNISVKSIGQVCYKPYYFRLNSNDRFFLHKIEDQNYIEKNVFKKQENSYQKLLKKITFPSLSSLLLNKSEVILFLETLITIKKRNPTYREQIIKELKEYIISDHFKKQAEIGIELSKKVGEIEPEKYFERFIEEATTSKEKQSDFYLDTFLDEENNTTKIVTQILLRYKLFIYHAPIGSEFITSDNPGFTMLPNGELLSFGGFGLPFTFAFPLTPKCCLYINYLNFEQDNYSLKKSIHIIHTNKNFVDTVNEGTYKIAIEKIFSYSQNTLSYFTM